MSDLEKYPPPDAKVEPKTEATKQNHLKNEDNLASDDKTTAANSPKEMVGPVPAKSDEFAEGFDLATLENVMPQTLVNVNMFGRTYNIKSDKPKLVRYLAHLVNTEAHKAQQQNNKLGPGHFDWPAQTAFRLALLLYQGQKNIDDINQAVADKTSDLAIKISNSLSRYLDDDSK